MLGAMSSASASLDMPCSEVRGGTIGHGSGRDGGFRPAPEGLITAYSTQCRSCPVGQKGSDSSSILQSDDVEVALKSGKKLDVTSWIISVSKRPVHH